MRTISTVLTSFAVGFGAILLTGCPIFGGGGDCSGYCGGMQVEILPGLYEPNPIGTTDTVEPTDFDVVQVDIPSDSDEVVVTFTDASGEEHTAVYAVVSRETL